MTGTRLGQQERGRKKQRETKRSWVMVRVTGRVRTIFERLGVGLGLERFLGDDPGYG